MDKKIYSIFIFFFVGALIANSQTTQLTVRGFSEGFYRASLGKMVAVIDPVNMPLVCDTGLIELIDSATMQSAFCSYELISTEGYGTCTVPDVLNGSYYFISIKFRNTFHVLSKVAVRLNGLPLSIDLTIPQNTCCNYDSANGVAKAFSGDVNNDGAIDGSDFLVLDPDIQSQLTGYVITDLNGDRLVDIYDFHILHNNILSGRSDDYFGGCSLIGILENDLNPVKLYPNPCTNYFTIELDRMYKNIRIQLYDVLGRIHADEKYDSELSLRINTDAWHTGIYYMRITAEGMREKQGVVIRN